MTARHVRLIAVVAAGLVSTSVPAAVAHSGLTGPHPTAASELHYTATDCIQNVVGVEVDAARVREFVPKHYGMLREAAGRALLGYRMQSCTDMRINNAAPRPVLWSELGVRILPPDGQPQLHVDAHVDGHDYYMLFLHTSSRAFATATASAGLPSRYIRQMRFDADQRTGLYGYERVPGEGTYEVIGTALPAFPNNQAFTIRGWLDAASGLVRYDEDRSNVYGVFANQVMHADRSTLLARLAERTEVHAIEPLVTYATTARGFTSP